VRVKSRSEDYWKKGPKHTSIALSEIREGVPKKEKVDEGYAWGKASTERSSQKDLKEVIAEIPQRAQ